MKWSDWNPGEAQLEETFNQILDTMPSAPIGGIPRLVHLLENPQSPFHLSGPAALRAHDIIHVGLGRGLLQQDEAFVIGYTMGNARSARNLDRLWFLDFAENAYPPPFRFRKGDADVFNLAFDCGANAKIRDIHLLDVDQYLNMALHDGRMHLGIEWDTIVAAFEVECRILPDTKVSTRLRTTHLIHGT